MLARSLVLAVVLLTGCGQMGPLYHPPPEPVTLQISAELR
jgi:predicted small lipoprotein YifL